LQREVRHAAPGACDPFILFVSHGAFAAEVRIAVPKLYLQDAFLQSLLASKELAEAGIKPTLLPTTTEHEAMAAVNSGAAALSVFSAAEADRRELQKIGVRGCAFGATVLVQIGGRSRADAEIISGRGGRHRCRPLRPFPAAIVEP
jgi:hypothetical protein